MRSFLILLCLPALGLSQIKAPRIGLVRYADSTVRAVYGLPASFVVGPASTTAVDAASFWDNGGILSSEGKLRIVTPDGAVLAEEAGSKNAIVEIDDSMSSAIAFLPESNTLVRFDGKEFQRT